MALVPMGFTTWSAMYGNGWRMNTLATQARTRSFTKKGATRSVGYRVFRCLQMRAVPTVAGCQQATGGIISDSGSLLRAPCKRWPKNRTHSDNWRVQSSENREPYKSTGVLVLSTLRAAFVGMRAMIGAILAWRVVGRFVCHGSSPLVASIYTQHTPV